MKLTTKLLKEMVEQEISEMEYSGPPSLENTAPASRSLVTASTLSDFAATASADSLSSPTYVQPTLRSPPLWLSGH